MELKHSQSLQESLVDIITLDVEMPEMSGIEVARKIIEENIETKIIFLTMYKDEDMFNEAIDIGASVHVLKENAVDVYIVDCIKEVSKWWLLYQSTHFKIFNKSSEKDVLCCLIILHL